jgi:predicted nucleotidyltransferase
MKLPTLVEKPIRRKSTRSSRRPRLRASIVRVLRRALPALSEKYNIKSFGIFGSYARGEQRATSDLDVLVEYGGHSHFLHG